MDIEPLQTDEVVKLLASGGDVEIFHLDTGKCVSVCSDVENKRAPWRIEYFHPDLLDKENLRQALELDLELRVGMYDGDGPLYLLHRNCFGVRAAAIKALRLVRVLPGVPADAWLYVSYRQHEREEDPPTAPTPWPPTETGPPPPP